MMRTSGSVKYGIEAYFTAAEFAELSEYEKLRLRNMKQNYEMMVKVGLDVPPPEFMRNTLINATSQESNRRENESSSGRKKGHKRSASFKVPVKKKPNKEQREIPATISTAPMSDAEFSAIATGEMSEDEFDGIDFEADFAADVKPVAVAKKSTESEQSGRKRYSLREGTRKSYKDLEVLEDDVYVYCEDCHELYEDDCPSHPLVKIKDSPVPVKCKHRAKLSLPPGLVVKEAGIQGAGDGVCAEKFFPRGVRFGPYGGEIVKERAGKESGYAWEIFQDKKRIHYINGKIKSLANWMRYVNCARNESEQNLIAFQYRSQIYYRSFKPIYPGNELLVYYGEEYAKELGIEECTFEDDGSDHICHICSRVFTIKLFLLKHLKYRHHQFVDLSLYRTKDSPVNQTLCKMIDHSQQNHGSNEIQGKVATKTTLNHHARIQTTSGEKPYKCGQCDVSCASRCDLTRHERIHTGIKPYKCTQCGKAFTQSCTLIRHERTHTGIKPYNCTRCDKAFTQSSNLTEHERTHTGIKPYKCTQCDKAFAKLYNLTAHERIHTGIKPYKCTQCGKAFTYSSHLTTHERTHTGIKPYK